VCNRSLGQPSVVDRFMYEFNKRSPRNNIACLSTTFFFLLLLLFVTKSKKIPTLRKRGTHDIDHRNDLFQAQTSTIRVRLHERRNYIIEASALRLYSCVCMPCRGKSLIMPCSWYTSFGVVNHVPKLRK
jgi:hypothetical protein